MCRVHVKTKSRFDRGKVWYILTGIGVSTTLVVGLACIIYWIWKRIASIYIVRPQSCRPESVSFADKDSSLESRECWPVPSCYPSFLPKSFKGPWPTSCRKSRRVLWRGHSHGDFVPPAIVSQV